MLPQKESAAKRSALRKIVEHYFSPEYLFDPVHELFRSIVSPPAAYDGNDDAGDKPPGLPLENLLRFSDVADATSHVDAKAEKIALLVEALKGSAVVECETREDDDEWQVRRRRFLRDDEDPAYRSVVVRPVHPEASEADIREFVKGFGSIVAVRRKKFGPDGDRNAGTATITFSSVDEALRCSKAVHSFGILSSALGQHFVPKVTVALQRTYEADVNRRQKEADQKQLQHNIHEAQRALISGTVKSASMPPGSATRCAMFEAKKFLTTGRTLKCVEPASSATWAVIKAKLGNLVLGRPSLKGTLSLVRVVEAGESPLFPKRTAFVIFKNAAAAEELLAMYAVASGAFMDGIRDVCPNLSELSAAEDAWVRQQFPQWTEKKMETKVDLNRKRHRGEK